MAKDLRLVDFFLDPIEIHEKWHTLIVPLNASEEPPGDWVAKVVVANFGHLPFAEARLPHADCDIIEKNGARALVVRFERRPLDPPPDMSVFEKKDVEAYRLAQISKGVA